MTTVTHTLKSPVQAHGAEVAELQLRRPTVQECRAIKALPYTVGDSGYPIMEVEVVGKYIAVCAGIPASSVNQLELRDLNALGWLVIGFFMDRDSTQSDS